MNIYITKEHYLEGLSETVHLSYRTFSTKEKALEAIEKSFQAVRNNLREYIDDKDITSFSWELIVQELDNDQDGESENIHYISVYDSEIIVDYKDMISL